MKQIIAIVRPFVAEKVLEALRLSPVEAMVVSEVKGFGRQKTHLKKYVEGEYSAAFIPKVEITLWVDDLRVDEVVQRITDVAQLGRMGDGKIMVLPVPQSIDIADSNHISDEGI